MDLSWLERRRERSNLSRWAQEGVRFALVIDQLGLSVPTVARLAGASERRVRRRLARARSELEADERSCACGCRETLPPSATAARRYLDETHKKRAWRRRAAARAAGVSA